MSQSVALQAPVERRGVRRLSGAVSDALAMAERNLITYRRVPQLLVFSTIQPVIFVLLFRYLFAYSLSWVFAFVGLAVGDPETAQAAAFPILAPLVFASSAFVSTATMPGWLRAFAEHQPVSVTASAVRALLEGGPTTKYVLQSLAWIVAIIVVAAPLAVRRYRRAV